MGLIERISGCLSGMAIIGLVVITTSEIVARTVFGFSFLIADEYGGYLLVAITLFSLPFCQSHNSFHAIEFFQGRLPPRGQAAFGLVYDVIAIAFCAIVLWQCGRLFLRTFHSGAESATLNGTPLWIPQLPLLVGMSTLLVPLARSTGAHFRSALLK